MQRFANPGRFMRIANAVLPWTAGGAVLAIGLGLYLGLVQSPPDYQQGQSVRIMYVHVPSAWMALFIYMTIAIASAVALIWRHPLADIAARAASPLGAAFAFFLFGYSFREFQALILLLDFILSHADHLTYQYCMGILETTKKLRRNFRVNILMQESARRSKQYCNRSPVQGSPFPPGRRPFPSGSEAGLSFFVDPARKRAHNIFRRGEAQVRQVRDHSKLPSPALRRIV